ncbi:SDR family NAD(P)-dependent oxidoreductase [Leucobacter zeae]|nr:SDR family NAD(P)-dependent oxidoreductase [Leucobacter zeae]
MEHEVKTIGVILAGGVGVRAGLGIPKQLVKIAGKSIVEHTLEVFQDNELIDEIIVMMNPGAIGELDYLRGSARFSKLTQILPGGKTRNDTTQLALEAIPETDCKLLFHDAVRPFIDDRIIEECVTALDSFDAVDTAIASADTIIEVGEDGCITDIPVRSKLRRGQTPQAFTAATIREAYRIAEGDPGFQATDDCGVIFKYLPEVPIFVVEGTAENMKITEPIDIHIADKIFQLQSSNVDPKHAELPDLTGQTVVVFGGSYGIGKSTVDLCREAGATVLSFSRSETGTDVSKRKHVRKALDQAVAQTGRIDHVVLTAGVLTIAPLNEAPRDEIKHTVRLNLLAPAYIAQESFAELQKTGGSLTLFTSSSYTRGRAGYSLYSATKAGVVNLTQALAEEWAEEGVRVNAINPQRTHTPMRTAAFGEEPSGTLLTPEDVAQATAAVLGNELTGQVISVRL